MPKPMEYECPGEKPAQFVVSRVYDIMAEGTEQIPVALCIDANNLVEYISRTQFFLVARTKLTNSCALFSAPSNQSLLECHSSC